MSDLSGSPCVRRLAADVLQRTRDDRSFAQDVLHDSFERTKLSARDRGLLTEIVMGVLRHRLTLDAIIEAFSSRPIQRIDAAVIDVLRIAAYQIIFLDRVPPSAAVNAAVESVKRMSGRARAAGFVNGLLRALCRGAGERNDDPPAATDRTRAVPMPRGGWQVLARPVLPDPQNDLGGHIAAAYSHPARLVRRWLERFGPEETARICTANNQPPALCLRPNRLRTTPDKLLAQLSEAGIRARIESDWIVLESRATIRRIPGFDEGHFQVQDPTAIRVVQMLGAAAGQRIADLCVAPGGKATYLCEIMGNDGMVVGVDLSLDRLRRTRENAVRLGATALRLVCADARTQTRPLRGEFDRVLIDVPCSNTGVLARRSEARWRVGATSLKRLVTAQQELLAAGLDMLAPDGIALYSTCSTEPEENDQIVRGVLARRPEFAMEDEQLFLPHRGPGDGGYAVTIRRRQ